MGRGGRETTENVANVLGGKPPPEKLYLEDTLGDAGDSVKANVTGRAEPAGTRRDENTLPGEVQVKEEVPPPSTEISASSPP